MVGWMVWYLGRRRRGEAADGRWKDEGNDDDDDDDDGERAREEQKRGLVVGPNELGPLLLRPRRL